MDFFKDLNSNYTPRELKNYSGRNSLSKDQYWHENIGVGNLKNLSNQKVDIGLIGYVCDEGVLRNKGRIGARKGPENIRHKLGKLPVHFDKKIVDFGDVNCIDHHLEDCQNTLSKIVSYLLSKKIFPIALGGGHDIALATFNGIKNYLEEHNTSKKIGIINFDAHFDLRKVKNQPNSGTPFYQILTENDHVSYFPIGIQKQSNTKELFEIAKNLNVDFLSNFDCEVFDESIKNKLTAFLNNVDYVYITIDLDCFSSAYAPGVSAPSPFGLSPNFVIQTLTLLLQSKKVIACDIAELNPEYDIDNTTAHLAARLVDFIVLNV